MMISSDMDAHWSGRIAFLVLVFCGALVKISVTQDAHHGSMFASPNIRNFNTQNLHKTGHNSRNKKYIEYPHSSLFLRPFSAHDNFIPLVIGDEFGLYRSERVSVPFKEPKAFTPCVQNDNTIGFCTSPVECLQANIAKDHGVPPSDTFLSFFKNILQLGIPHFPSSCTYVTNTSVVEKGICCDVPLRSVIGPINSEVIELVHHVDPTPMTKPEEDLIDSSPLADVRQAQYSSVAQIDRGHMFQKPQNYNDKPSVVRAISPVHSHLNSWLHWNKLPNVPNNYDDDDEENDFQHVPSHAIHSAVHPTHPPLPTHPPDHTNKPWWVPKKESENTNKVWWQRTTTPAPTSVSTPSTTTFTWWQRSTKKTTAKPPSTTSSWWMPPTAQPTTYKPSVDIWGPSHWVEKPMTTTQRPTTTQNILFGGVSTTDQCSPTYFRSPNFVDYDAIYKDTTQRITGGGPVIPHSYPWMALLFLGQKQVCGASLVDDIHVLTAAHCVASLSSRQIDQMRVVLGVHNIHLHEPSRQEFKIKTVVRHKDYSRLLLYNDVAILTLDRPVKITKEVRPICLYTGSDQFVGQFATVAGWGSLFEGGRQLHTPRQVSLRIWSNNECRETYGHAAPGGVVESYMCAGKQSKDACSGDSGGPIFKNIDGVWKQIGLVSWGIGCGKGQYPGVYSRMSSFLPWITRVREKY